jgi:hypothetical protein
MSLRLVTEAEESSTEAAPVQRPLRVLTVAPLPAAGKGSGVLPLGPLEVVPMADGQCLLVGDPTPERRRELGRLAYEVMAERDTANVSTCNTPDKVRATMRARLADFGRRAGTSALYVAGRVFLAHGDRARAELARLILDEKVWAKADDYLDRAGLPPHDALPGIG